jgi:hypothetical protein
MAREYFIIGGELRFSIGTQSRVIVSRRVEGRHSGGCPELGILKEPGCDVHRSEVIQLKKAPLESQLSVDVARVQLANCKLGYH